MANSVFGNGRQSSSPVLRAREILTGASGQRRPEWEKARGTASDFLGSPSCTRLWGKPRAKSRVQLGDPRGRHGYKPYHQIIASVIIARALRKNQVANAPASKGATSVIAQASRAQSRREAMITGPFSLRAGARPWLPFTKVGSSGTGSMI